MPSIDYNGRITNRSRYWDEVLRRIPADRPIVGVEIGVWQGDLSSKLLAARPLLTLWLVDPWKLTKTGKASHSLAACAAAYDQACQVSRDNGGRGRLLRLSSQEAVTEFPEESLDLFFLDAIHTFEEINADIQAWLPKLKLGGWYGGRDFADRFAGVERETYRKNATVGVDRTWFIESTEIEPCHTQKT